MPREPDEEGAVMAPVGWPTLLTDSGGVETREKHERLSPGIWTMCETRRDDTRGRGRRF